MLSFFKEQVTSFSLSTELAGIVQRFQRKNVDLVVLDQGIDTTTLYGRLQFNILAAIGEFERELIKERSVEGRAKVIARGVC